MILYLYSWPGPTNVESKPSSIHTPDFLKYRDQLPIHGHPNSQLLPPPTQPVVDIPTDVRIKYIS